MMATDNRLSHETWLSVIDEAIRYIEGYHQRRIDEGSYRRLDTEEMGEQRLNAMRIVRQYIVDSRAQRDDINPFKQYDEIDMLDKDREDYPVEVARHHAERARREYECVKKDYEYYQSLALRPGLLSAQAQREGFEYIEEIIKNHYNTVTNTKG